MKKIITLAVFFLLFLIISCSRAEDGSFLGIKYTFFYDEPTLSGETNFGTIKTNEAYTIIYDLYTGRDANSPETNRPEIPNIKSISISDLNNFSLDTTGTNFKLGFSDHTSFKVTFNPKSIGEFNTQLSIKFEKYDDVDGEPADLTLTLIGEGIL